MSLITRIKARYKAWEAGSKEREKKKLDKIQGKRAREAVRHLYQMERARRKYELEEQLAKVAVANLRRKKAEAQAKKLSSGSVLGKLLDYGTSTKKRRSAKRR